MMIEHTPKYEIGDVLIDKNTGEKAIITDKFIMGLGRFYDIMVVNTTKLKAMPVTYIDDNFNKVKDA